MPEKFVHLSCKQLITFNEKSSKAHSGTLPGGRDQDPMLNPQAFYLGFKSPIFFLIGCQLTVAPK